MAIVAQCPNGHRVKVKGDGLGKKAVCPTCQAKFRVGPPAAAADPAAALAGLPVAREVPLDPAVIATLPRAVPLGSVRAAADAAAAQARAAAAVEPPSESAGGDAHVVDVEDTPAPLRPRRRYIAVIAEGADLTWCIAYPGGDPSAPIDGATMQDWLESGQADGTEVVWRADWPEWHPVREIFPEFFPAGG